MFDPDAFMQSTVDAPMETKFRIIPEGEYRAMVDDFDSSAFQEFEFTYKKTGQPGKMTKFTIPFSILDEKVKAELGRDNLRSDMQVILDLDENGNLATGPDKNVKLGQLRAAVGQNSPGPWSFSQLRGAGPVVVKISHESGKDPEQKFARVTRVAPLR